jgi:hypothetical protein
MRSQRWLRGASADGVPPNKGLLQSGARLAWLSLTWQVHR